MIKKPQRLKQKVTTVLLKMFASKELHDKYCQEKHGRDLSDDEMCSEWYYNPLVEFVEEFEDDAYKLVRGVVDETITPETFASTLIRLQSYSCDAWEDDKHVYVLAGIATLSNGNELPPLEEKALRKLTTNIANQIITTRESGQG